MLAIRKCLPPPDSEGDCPQQGYKTISNRETENERNDSRSLNGNGGPEFIVTPTFRVYPPSVKTLRVGFAARGKGMIRLYSFAEKNLKPVEVQLDSAEWKRYETDIPLCDTHLRALTVRFISQKRDPIDFDDLVVKPAANPM